MAGDRKNLCGFPIFGAAVGVISFAMLIIGGMNAASGKDGAGSGCRAEPMVPWVMVIGGIINLCLIVGRVIVTKLCSGSCCGEEVNGSLAPALKLLTCSVTFFYDLFGLMVTAGWLIGAAISVGALYSGFVNKVVTTIKSHVGAEESLETQQVVWSSPGSEGVLRQSDGIVDCNPVLYHFSWLVMVVGWIFVILAVVFLVVVKCLCGLLCCKPCKDLTEKASTA